MIPTTIWILHTSEATVVAMTAHFQVDLFDAIICRHVEWFSLLTDFHYLYGFVLCNFENVEKLGIWFSILHELNDFVNAARVGSDIENFEFLVCELIADSVEVEKLFDISKIYIFSQLSCSFSLQKRRKELGWAFSGRDWA